MWCCGVDCIHSISAYVRWYLNSPLFSILPAPPNIVLRSIFWPELSNKGMSLSQSQSSESGTAQNNFLCHKYWKNVEALFNKTLFIFINLDKAAFKASSQRRYPWQSTYVPWSMFVKIVKTNRSGVLKLSAKNFIGLMLMISLGRCFNKDVLSDNFSKH